MRRRWNEDKTSTDKEYRKRSGVFIDSFANDPHLASLLSTKHSYYLADNYKKRREQWAHLAALSFSLQTVSQYMTFTGFCLFLLIADFKFFEFHVIKERTGWGRDKTIDALKELVDQGYIEVKKPKHDVAFYKDQRYKPQKKFYPTLKYERKYKEVMEVYHGYLKEYEGSRS